MESGNKKEAIRAKEIALEKMKNKDFPGARKFSVRAQQLCPDLEDIVQMILVCDIHCSAAVRVGKDEKDWYKILKVEPTANEASIRRQCNRLALGLHPDKNSFPGAADAFQLIREARTVLTDDGKRRSYDSRCNAEALRNRCFTRFWDNCPDVTVSKVSKYNRPRPSEGSRRSGKRKMVSDVADDMERPRNRRSFNVAAQEIDPQGRRTARFVSKGKNEVNNMEGNQSPGKKSFPDRKLRTGTASGIDFDKRRPKECFQPGQTWAVYDTIDALPRFYALINKVLPAEFRVQITWLEPCPENEKERKWLCQGLPASCGKFKLGESDSIEDHAIFSHLVNWRKSIHLRDIYQIYPRKGETWALFKNWNINWCMNPDRPEEFELVFVEILGDYDCAVGVSVAFLGRIEGFSSLFSRLPEEAKESEVIPVTDRLRFSHRVPSFQMTSKEGANGITRFFELDTASLPGIAVSDTSTVSRNLNEPQAEIETNSATRGARVI